MRVSADKSDPGYTPNTAPLIVFFNGLELQGCLTADEERGIAVIRNIDEDGRVLEHVTLHGHVHVWTPEGWQP